VFVDLGGEECYPKENLAHHRIHVRASPRVFGRKTYTMLEATYWKGRGNMVRPP